ncbi:MAG: histidine--tRNA ligase [Thermoplasmata archaeon]|nr:histidine--tRNA ligase [Thermoplasmata archaeon]
MPEFQRPRGTRDFGPEEMAKRRLVESKLRETARLFGFGEVMTPTFESTDLFVEKSGEDIVGEIYAFEDKKNRKIALRPELTASVMRFYVNEMQSLPKPVKIFYFGNMFRYERPQKGRYREFFQFGAELIGAPSIEADAEILALAYYCTESVNASVADIRIGHLGVLKTLFDKYSIDDSHQIEIRRFLDKKDFEGMNSYFSNNSLSNEALKYLKKIALTKGSPDKLDDIKNLLGSECESIDYLIGLAKKIEEYGIRNYSIDLGVARGLDYYTGMVFEIDGVGLGAESQICGGGAYSLAKLFGGKEVYSTGFAFGFDRLMIARNSKNDRIESLDAYIVPVSNRAKKRCIEVASILRNKKISAEIDLLDRSISKAMKYANTVKVKNVIIIGNEELNSMCVTIKNMKTGIQEKVKEKDIVQYITKCRN